jgi:hypothetical protein
VRAKLQIILQSRKIFGKKLARIKKNAYLCTRLVEEAAG